MLARLSFLIAGFVLLTVMPAQPAAVPGAPAEREVQVGARLSTESAAPGDPVQLEVVLDFQHGWHVWSNDPQLSPEAAEFFFPIPTRIEAASNGGVVV